MFRKQPFAVIENVIVDVAARGLGVGTTLFQAIEMFCVSTNCSRIMLLSSSQRLDSHAFFEKQGFKGAVKRGFVSIVLHLLVQGKVLTSALNNAALGRWTRNKLLAV